MPAAAVVDLHRVIHGLYVQEGWSLDRIAKLVGWTRKTVAKYARQPGVADRRKVNKGRPLKVTVVMKQDLAKYVRESAKGAVPKGELRRHLRATFDVAVSKRHMQRVLRKTDFIKRFRMETTHQIKDVTKANRIHHCIEYGDVDRSTHWFGDEIYLSLQGAFPSEARYYSTEAHPAGPPHVEAFKPYKHHKKTQVKEGFSICAAISATGKTQLCRFKGKINTNIYIYFIETYLRPAMEESDIEQPMNTRQDRLHTYWQDQDSSRRPPRVAHTFWGLRVDAMTLGPKCWQLNPLEKWWGLWVADIYDSGFRRFDTVDALWDQAQASWETVWEQHRAIIPLMIQRIPLYAKAIVDVDGRLLTKKEERIIEQMVP
jgi:transposase